MTVIRRYITLLLGNIIIIFHADRILKFSNFNGNNVCMAEISPKLWNY